MGDEGDDEEIGRQLTSSRKSSQQSLSKRKSPPKRVSQDIESHAHFDEVTAEVTSFVYLVAIVVAIGGFLFG